MARQRPEKKPQPAPPRITSAARRPWDARRITGAIISAVIVALAVVVYLLGL